MPKLALGPLQLSIQWRTKAFSLKLKRPGRQWQLIFSSAGVNGWNCLHTATNAPPLAQSVYISVHVCAACCHLAVSRRPTDRWTALLCVPLATSRPACNWTQTGTTFRQFINLHSKSPLLKHNDCSTNASATVRMNSAVWTTQTGHGYFT
jgi:hypothetical protein